MQNDNGYKKIDRSIEIYQKSDDDSEREDAINFLIESFTPLLISNIKHFFGRVDEDLLQDGREKIINLAIKFDIESKYNFNGYLKKNIYFFYLNKKKKSKKKVDTISGDALMTVKSYDIPDFETYSTLYRLEEKERNIISMNVIDGIKLKTVSNNLKISYSNAKKLKKKALDKLRKELLI